MAIARNQRTYPLTLKSTTAYALNAGIVAAHDYAGNPDNAYAGGDGAPHVGTKTFTKDAGANFPVVTVQPGIIGRDISQGKTAQQAYRGYFIGALGFGSADGKSSFAIHQRYRAPTSFTTTTARTVLRYSDQSSAGRITLMMKESSDGYVYFYWLVYGQNLPNTTNQSAVANRVPFGTICDLYLVRDGATVNAYMGSTLVATANLPDLVVYNTNWSGADSGTQHGFTGSPAPNDLIVIDQTIWNRALSAAEVTQHFNDPYAGYVNSAVVPNGIKITGPAADARVSNEGFPVSGTYSGSTPTSIQARFNGGAWTTIVSSPSGGSFIGNIPATAPATGLLEVRYSNNTSVTDSITITTAQPVPSVSFVSQAPPDGQTLNLQISVQRAVSWQVELVPDGGGSVRQVKSSSITYSTSAATVPVSFTAVAPGSYQVNAIVTNSSGTIAAIGTPFTILGVSGGGNGASDIPDANIPSAPSNVVAVAGNGFADVSFSAPSGNGAEITGYIVNVSTGATVNTEASPVRVTVPNGTAVTFTVAAVNRIGQGPFSSPSAAVTPSPTRPEPPQNVSASAIPGSAIITFLPPASNGGSPVIQYEAVSSTGQRAVGNNSPIVIDTVEGVATTFVVYAINAIGPSLPSQATQPVTSGSAPSAPRGVSALPGNGKVVVSFSAPLSDGGYPVTEYVATASTGQTTSGSVSPLTLVVPNDVAITVTVVAKNNIGTSTPSAASASITPRAPEAKFILIGVDGVPVRNIGGLNYAWFDSKVPSLFAAPTDKGDDESTNSVGEILIKLPGSKLSAGDVGWLIVTNSDGSLMSNHLAFSGPVEVS